jgi:hypothetical protein
VPLTFVFLQSFCFRIIDDAIDFKMETSQAEEGLDIPADADAFVAALAKEEAVSDSCLLRA